MRKRLISICFVVILVCGICGCARTAEETLGAETETAELKYAEAEDAETAMSADEYGQSEEKMILPEQKDDQDESDAEIEMFYRTAEEDCGCA